MYDWTINVQPWDCWGFSWLFWLLLIQSRGWLFSGVRIPFGRNCHDPIIIYHIYIYIYTCVDQSYVYTHIYTYNIYIHTYIWLTLYESTSRIPMNRTAGTAFGNQRWQWEIPHGGVVNIIYPLVNVYKKLLKMAIEIVDSPIRNDDFP